MISTTRFDKNSDLSSTYVGKIDIARASKIKAEEKFPISEQGYMIGNFIDGTECQILLDMLPCDCIEYYVIAMLHPWAQSIPYYHILPYHGL